MTAGRDVLLGSPADGGGALEISDAELDRITTASLFIGGSDAGDISVVGAVSPALVSTVTLQGSGDIWFSADFAVSGVLNAYADNIYQLAATGISATNFNVFVDRTGPDGNTGGVANFQGGISAAIRIAGAADADVLSGSTAGETLLGLGGADTLFGGDGDDSLIGGAGADALFGGNGSDRAQYSDSAAGLTADLQNAGLNTGIAAGDTYDSVEGLYGSAFADSLRGDAGANTLTGADGNDSLYGRDGNDSLSGGDGDDLLSGGIGADVHEGGAGTDRAQYSDAAAGLLADLQNAASNTGIAAGDTYASVENLWGSDFNDTLRGNSAANTLWGDEGNDTLYGRNGNDVLNGGDGNDIFVGGAGADSHQGGSGTDRAQYSDAAAGLTADLQVAASNTGIAAGDTYDSVEGLYGSNFADTLRGDASANTLWGSGGNDTLHGRSANDTVNGGDGDDVLAGGHGNDSLIGGAGQDGFLFDAALSAATNLDRISDFSVADDTVRLDNDIFAALAAGVLDAAAFRIGAAAADASDRIIYNSATGALLYDADGNGAGAAVQFAVMTTGLALTSNDFLVV